MIVATSQDFAEINCGCCLPEDCSRPRLDCASSSRVAEIDGYLDSSEPYSNITDILAKKIYSSKKSKAEITWSSSGITYDKTNTYSGIYLLEKDKNHYIYALTGCPSATNPAETISCDATGAFTWDQYGEDPVGVRGHVVWELVYTLEPDTYSCGYEYYADGTTYAEGPPGTWTSTAVTHDPDIFHGGSMGTNGQLSAPRDGTPTYTVTYLDGVTIEDWMRTTVGLLDDFIDIPAMLVSHPSCASRCASGATQPIASTILISWEPVNSFNQRLSLRKTQYRIGVPYVAADMPRSVFEAQWDVFSFPNGWLDWQALVEAFDAAVLAHAEWVIAQTFYDDNIGAYNTAYAEWEILNAPWIDYYILHEYWEFYPEDFPEGEPQPPEGEPPVEPTPPPDPGEEPAIPDDPGAWADSPLNTCDPLNEGPKIISSEEWIWDGDMGTPNANPIIFATNDEQWSPWFTVPIPELPTPLSDAFDEDGVYLADCINRDVRICNMMTKCYHATSAGVVPTIHEPIFVQPDPQLNFALPSQSMYQPIL